MSTRPESDTSGDTAVTSLAEGIRDDGPKDSRACKQESCHGTLTVDDDDRVYCSSCRCTPAGVFLGFNHDEHGSSNGTTGFPSYNPKGQQGEDRVVESWDHDEYDYSNRVRLAGGYEPVYDVDEDNRPRGVGDEYTFDLSTL